MKPFKRKKIVNGQEYLYEITPYYDKEKKYARQKSKYLGKIENGKVFKVREINPISAFRYADAYLCFEILKKFKIPEFLTLELGDKNSKIALVLIIARAIDSVPLNQVNQWYEGSFLYNEFGVLNLTTSTLSRFINYLGNHIISENYSKFIAKQLSPKKTLYYDITSLSSYSQNIDWLEWGYNRDGLDLPQLNLSVVIDKESNIPFMHQIYPGNITDVTTIVNTIKRLKANEVENSTMVIDRGFFSNDNIKELIATGSDFIIPVPKRYNLVEKMITKEIKNITKPSLSYLIDNQVIYAKSVEINTGEVKLNGYCYYNPKRAINEKDTFMKNLLEVKNKIEKIVINDKPVLTKIKEIAGKYRQYITYQVQNEKVICNIKEKKVTAKLSRAGIFLLAYQGKFSETEALSLYKSKDSIEKGFDILKNDLNIHTPNIQKTENFKGLVFLTLISLTIRLQILKKLKESKLNEKFGIDGLFLELKKIHKIKMSNGEFITSEITKKQNEIMKIFDIVPKI